jgi:general secretion pathway protein L
MDGLAGLRTVIAGMVRTAVAWWLAELAAVIPQRFANRPENAPVTLDISAGEATLVLAGRGAAQPVRMPLGGEDWAQIRARVQTALGRNYRKAVVIRLDESLLLDAFVTLPLNAERSLRPILLNQLERLVPLPADEVEFEYVVTQRSTKTKTLGVKLIVATRESIERAVALLRSLGLTPGVAIAPSSFVGLDRAAVLWRANQEQMDAPAQRWLRRGMEVAAVAILIGAYGAYVHRLTGYRDQLEQDVVAATKASAAARDLVNRNAQTQTALGALQRRQREMDPAQLLSELTKLVPDTSWVSQLSVRGRDVEIIGYSPRVSDLISRIENHDIFYDPKFRSPITMSPDGKGERFDVSFNVWIEDPK